MGAGRAAQHFAPPETVKVLEMTVLSAKGLAISTRLGRLMSLYVRISLDGKQRQTTKCVRSSGPEPEWNEKLFFNLDEDTLARPLDPSRRLITPDDDFSGFLIEIYQGRPLSRKLLGAQILTVMQAIEFSNSGFTYHTLCLRGSEAYINLGLRLADPVVPMDQDVEMQPGCSPKTHLRSNSCVRRPSVVGMTLDQNGAGVAVMRSPPPQVRGTANACQQPGSMSVKKAAAVAVASVGLPPPRSPAAPPVAPLSPMRDHVLAIGPSSAQDDANKSPVEGLARVLSIGNSSRKRVEALPARPQFRSGSSRVSAEPSGSHKGAYDSSNMPPVRLIKRPGLAFSTKGPPLPKLVVPYRDRVAQSQQNANGACAVGKAGTIIAQPLDRCSSESENVQGESGARANGHGRIEETQPSARVSKSGGPRLSPRNPVANPNYYKLQGDASLASSSTDYAGVEWSPVGVLFSPGLCLGRERGSGGRDHNDRWHLPAVLEVEETCLTPTAGRSASTNVASTLPESEIGRTGRVSTHDACEGADNLTKVESSKAVAAAATPGVTAAIPTTPPAMMSASSPSIGG
ncbi:hypothetical protein CBR_g51999 [Chara braunii]|uniref:C2 domain-containing protein n=1 Tax=Chara braunii TaxID=69332 RepID=A0A388K6L8_CHABU|nr:hypothetical protein CBR_g51999 [Chara braunii]|eukprot:GBG65698.1 hypothetical protein CBR_g51999 [Chara braunii]